MSTIDNRVYPMDYILIIAGTLVCASLLFTAIVFQYILSVFNKEIDKLFPPKQPATNKSNQKQDEKDDIIEQIKNRRLPIRINRPVSNIGARKTINKSTVKKSPEEEKKENKKPKKDNEKNSDEENDEKSKKDDKKKSDEENDVDSKSKRKINDKNIEKKGQRKNVNEKSKTMPKNFKPFSHSQSVTGSAIGVTRNVAPVIEVVVPKKPDILCSLITKEIKEISLKPLLNRFVDDQNKLRVEYTKCLSKSDDIIYVDVRHLIEFGNMRFLRDALVKLYHITQSERDTISKIFLDFFGTTIDSYLITSEKEEMIYEIAGLMFFVLKMRIETIIKFVLSPDDSKNLGHVIAFMTTIKNCKGFDDKILPGESINIYSLKMFRGRLNKKIEDRIAEMVNDTVVNVNY